MNLDQLTKAGRNKLTVLLEQERTEWTRNMRHWKKVKGQAGDEMRKWYSDFKKFHLAMCYGTDLDELLKQNLLTGVTDLRFRDTYTWALREREIIDNWES